MRIDTATLQNIGSEVANNMASLSFSTYSLQNRHDLIQSKLWALSSYFYQSANVIHQVESNLLSGFQKGDVSFYHNENLNVAKQIQKKPVESNAYVELDATYAKASTSFTSTYVSAGGNLNVGQIKAVGECSCSLWKNEELNPNISLNGQLSASLVSSDVQARAGFKDVYVTANALGSAGVVYANASAIFNASQQTIDLGVGAAALRGSCSISFHIFGVNVTLTGSGSIGSAEANISYSHKSREWEFGSKLGFIAGLGFNVKVSY